MMSTDRLDGAGAGSEEPRVPFLLRFGEAQPTGQQPTHRYDAMRQESDVQVDGEWRPALEVDRAAFPGTLTTEVKKETTDNE